MLPLHQFIDGAARSSQSPAAARSRAISRLWL
jgi:hypothetical protein